MNYTPQDIELILNVANEAHKTCGMVLDRQGSPQERRNEIDGYRDSLNIALDGLEGLETHYSGLIRQYQQKKDEVRDLKKKLDRDAESLKTASIRISQGLKRANIQESAPFNAFPKQQ